MQGAKPAGYSSLQIGLHWTVVALIIFQFLAHDGIEHAFDSFIDGAPADSGDVTFAWFHVAAGLTIFLAALARLYLRFTRGAPPLPASEPAPLRFVAHGTHFLLYALIIGMPISGSVAWFLGVEEAGDAHGAASTLLLIVATLHVAGALFQHFIMRSDVLARMLAPKG